MSERELFEKIAGMLARDVPQNQIADVMGLSDGRVSQIKEMPEFREIYKKHCEEYYEERKLFDSGWDSVENAALSILIKRMQFTNDPDFALKAAMVANKANRRSRAPGNEPIPARVGAGVILHMTGDFIQRLQVTTHQTIVNNGTVEVEVIEDGKVKKQVNMLEPAMVEKLFSNQGTPIKEDEDMNEALEGVFTPSYVSA